MNYGDIKLGTWYPKGGMYSVVEAMTDLAESLGVQFEFNAPVHKLDVQNGNVKSVKVNGHEFNADVVGASADYHHVEQNLLPESHSRS